jgi:hypothetical protein
VLFIQFPPLAKNVLGANKEVASLFLAIFSVGIAIGSVAINRLLKGQVSARYAPASVIVMGLFVVVFFFVCRNWHLIGAGELYDIASFVKHPDAALLLLSLLGELFRARRRCEHCGWRGVAGALRRARGRGRGGRSKPELGCVRRRRAHASRRGRGRGRGGRR